MTEPLLHETLQMQKCGLSRCDGAYVAMAKILKGKWLTCDRKAHAAVKTLHLSVLIGPVPGQKDWTD